MTIENKQEEQPITEKKEEKDFFTDHFDPDTRRKIIGTAAGFGGDFERIIFMAHKKPGAKTMTREELISLLPKDLREALEE
jgi:hypothetical protein